jgi:hypothetical protein
MVIIIIADFSKIKFNDISYFNLKVKGTESTVFFKKVFFIKIFIFSLTNLTMSQHLKNKTLLKMF